MYFYHKRVCVGKNAEKYIAFSVPIENKVRRIDKKDKKLQKLYLVDYNALIAQDLQQAYY